MPFITPSTHCRKAIPMYSMTLQPSWACKRSSGRLGMCMASTRICWPWYHAPPSPSSCFFPSPLIQRKPRNKACCVCKLGTSPVSKCSHKTTCTLGVCTCGACTPACTHVTHITHRGGASKGTGANGQQACLLYQANHWQRMWYCCAVAHSGEQPACAFPWYVFVLVIAALCYCCCL